MTKTLSIAGAAALALTLAACGGSETATGDNSMLADNEAMAADPMMNDMAAMPNAAMPMANSPQEYVTMAGASDMFEIESSKLAQEKAQRAEVKTFAGMLVADHQKSTAMLKTAAAAAQPPITVSPALDADKQMKLDALRNASAADFDRLYLSQQVPAHEQALALLRGYAEAGQVEQLKEHARTTMGPVEKHLAEARQLSQQ